MMRQLFLSISRALVILALPLAVILIAPQVSAVDVFPACDGNAKSTDVCKSVPNHGTPGNNPVIGAIKVTIVVLSFIIGVAAVIMIIIAGFSMITANGDAQAIGRARSTIIYALVGLVIVALAQVLVVFVLNKL